MIDLADVPEWQPRQNYICPGCKTPIPFGTEIKAAPDNCPTCNRRLYIPTIVGPTRRGKGPAENNPPSEHETPQAENRVVGGVKTQTRSQAFWSGARRGGKFGAKVALVILLVLYCFGVALIVLFPDMREKMLADLTEESVLSSIVGFLGGTMLFVLYGVVPSAIIMGIVAMERAAPVPKRFSLRTLLIATTVVAAVLGFVVWASR